jgi:PAS domain S-box-containing protein
VSGIAVGFNYVGDSRKIHAQLEEKADEYMSFLSSSLAVPLWNFETKTVKQIGAFFGQNELVCELRITDCNKVVFFDVKKGGEPPAIIREKNIFHNRLFAGTVRLSLSSLHYEKLHRYRLWSAVITIFIILVSLTVMTGLLLRIFLRRPLIQLNEVVNAYTQGQYELSEYRIACSEFEPFVAVLEKMGREIRNRIKEMADAEEKYRNIFENAVEGIFQTKVDGSIISVNPAMIGILGYDSEDDLRLSVSDVSAQLYVNSDDRQRLIAALIRDGSVSGFETELYRKDKTQIRVALSVRAVRDKNRDILYLEGSLTDITERIRREQAEKEREIAERANRAKSQFLANMSHELRTPLNAILGFSQLMLRDRNLMADYRENLETIARSGEHLLTMINQVLDLSKIEAKCMILNEKSFDFHRMLDDLENMFTLRAQEKHLLMIFERSADVPRYICADEVRLRQVIINLIGNAVKFTKEGGIALRISSKYCGETLVLQFEIEDTGAGMDEAELNTVFDAFVQSETGILSGEGTGLGLAISRQFVKLMGGKMTVNSRRDRGSVFGFTVSVRPADNAEISIHASDRRVMALAPDQPKYRILITDDKWDNRHLLAKLLGKLGFEVREAENGQETLEIWESWEPHLIWMDMRMPVMDGYEASRRIKATLKGQATAIIALTASAFEEDRKLVISAGCDDFVRKPFRESEIFEMMEKHIGVRFVYEEDEKTCQESENRDTEPNTEDWAAVPKELSDALQDATVRADMNRIAEIIDQIGKFDKNIGDMLRRMAEGFEYAEILRMIRIARREHLTPDTFQSFSTHRHDYLVPFTSVSQ